MRKQLFLCGALAALIGPGAVVRSQTATPAEPQYVNQFFVLGANGQLTPLEREPMHHAIKRKNIPLIKVNIESRQDVDGGPASPVHVGATPRFIVKMMTGDIDPTTLMHLIALKVDKQGRYYVTGDTQGFVYTNGKSTGPQGDAAQLKIAKYGQSSLEVEPAHPLPAGEYALVINPQMVDCFSVDPGLASSTAPSPSSATSENVQPAKPRGWIIDKLPEIDDTGKDVQQTGAILEGNVTYKGRKAGAYLVMHCDFPTKDYDGLLPLEAILDAHLGAQDLLNTPGGTPVDISDFGQSQLGDAAPIHVNAKGQNRTSGARYRFFYDPADMEEIVAGAGRTLQLSLNSGSGEPADPVLRFNLPADAEPVRQVMNSCLAKAAAEAQDRQAKTVASCPAKPGETLDTVVLEYADTGKAVKGDFDEMDNGADWKLPQPAKGHAARKIVMICQYKKSGNSGSQNAVSDSEKVLLPSTARSCDFTPHLNESRSAAACLSIPAPAPNATGSLPAPSAEMKAAAATSGASLPAGPVAPVNKLNVRGISVRMGRNQIISAAQAAKMRVIENIPSQLKLVDQSASGSPTGDDSGSGGSGLVLLINLANDAATSVRISEQGDIHGHVFEDLCKKWGKPSHLPSGYDSELGTSDPATWGDKKGIYASYNPSLYSFGGQNVTIFDGVALAPHAPARKSVPM